MKTTMKEHSPEVRKMRAAYVWNLQRANNPDLSDEARRRCRVNMREIEKRLPLTDYVDLT